RKDEIYGFRANPRSATNPAMHILATVDESTYRGGTANADHPMSWYCSYSGGRAWTTAMGHVTLAYSDSLFLGHLLGGMEYLLGHATVSVTDDSPQPPSVKIRRAGAGKAAFTGARFGTDGEIDCSGRSISPR
ncbi:MAG: ThuA domain-containing protein, partial [Fibrobacteria bacterium]